MIFHVASHCPQVGTLIEAPGFLLTHRAPPTGQSSVCIDHHGRRLECFYGERALVEAMRFCHLVAGADAGTRSGRRLP